MSDAPTTPVLARLQKLLERYPRFKGKPLLDSACDVIEVLDHRVEELHTLVAELRADILTN